MKKLLLPLLILLPSLLWSQSDCNISIGTNLEGPTDYGSEWPFVNIFKLSRDWITHNHPDWTGGVPWDPWDTGLSGQIPRDENGYPLEVPFDVEGADTSQVVRTVWANTMQLPSGTYTFLYDGKGKIEFWGDASVLSESPGRMEVAVNGGNEATNNIMAMEIMESQQGDHIRNIRFLLPGTEETYIEAPWAESWLEKLEPFQSLRFMDWGLTNGNETQNWEDRPSVNDFTYTIDGIPYEHMIRICNLKQADAWLCIPHRANEEYIRNMAQLFRDSLDPELTLYVEYSNEVWNWIFPQAHYGLDSLDQSLEWPERLGPKIAEVMRFWTEEFNGQEDRLVRVMGCQHGWFDIGRRIFTQIEAEGNAHLIDAISPAAYMSIDADQLNSLGASATAEDVIEGAGNFTFDTDEYAMQGWYDHAQLAEDKGKMLLYYEGGQHFTPNPWGTVQPYNQALMAAQEAEEMYPLYHRLLDTLESLTSENSLFMHFSFISPLWEDPNMGAYGNFGSLTSQFHQSEPYDNAPKYRALRDYIDSCESTVYTVDKRIDKDIHAFPNPTSGHINIAMDGYEGEHRLEIMGVNGKIIEAFHTNGHELITIDLGHLLPGIYWLRILDNQAFVAAKRIILTY